MAASSPLLISISTFLFSSSPLLYFLLIFYELSFCLTHSLFLTLFRLFISNDLYLSHLHTFSLFYHSLTLLPLNYVLFLDFFLHFDLPLSHSLLIFFLISFFILSPYHLRSLLSPKFLNRSLLLSFSFFILPHYFLIKIFCSVALALSFSLSFSLLLLAVPLSLSLEIFHFFSLYSLAFNLPFSLLLSLSHFKSPLLLLAFPHSLMNA